MLKNAVWSLFVVAKSSHLDCQEFCVFRHMVTLYQRALKNIHCVMLANCRWKTSSS